MVHCDGLTIAQSADAPNLFAVGLEEAKTIIVGLRITAEVGITVIEHDDSRCVLEWSRRSVIPGRPAPDSETRRRNFEGLTPGLF